MTICFNQAQLKLNRESSSILVPPWLKKLVKMVLKDGLNLKNKLKVCLSTLGHISISKLL